ncbi:uncharacterized protein [Triticum aestivum]|uniref:uncharacterized protein n=1 Tax=Triticum aestivum TaxID=4565 RepID=UPI001D02C08F|nr:uncharacterized protein LOC123087079 [Triticum aestivum]
MGRTRSSPRRSSEEQALLRCGGTAVHGGPGGQQVRLHSYRNAEVRERPRWRPSSSSSMSVGAAAVIPIACLRGACRWLPREEARLNGGTGEGGARRGGEEEVFLDDGHGEKAGDRRRHC